jgi:hypothetical protein
MEQNGPDQTNHLAMALLTPTASSEPIGSVVSVADPLKVYWQPGCSSCLRAKAFLAEHGIPFVSMNVLADPQ